MIHGTSFSKLLEHAINEYYTHIKYNDFKEDLTDDEHLKYQNELEALLKDFKNRIYDKYEFSALKLLVPRLFNDTNYGHENIIRDQLKAKMISTKEKFKKNGYCSIFVILETPDRRKIELQLQTYFRYKESKIGNSKHINVNNKRLDISGFFELKDEFKDNKYYEKILKESINVLNTTTIAERNKLLSIPTEYLDQKQQKLKNKIEFAQDNLQIKEWYEDTHTFPDGTQQTTSYSLEEYLPIFAEYNSPKLKAVSSAHSRVNKNIAFVNIKTIIDNFREILLESDETTCLSDILLKKLQTIEEKNSTLSLSKNKMQNILASYEISDETIQQIIHDMEKISNNNISQKKKSSYTNSVSDIKERVRKEEDEKYKGEEI